VVAPAAAVHDDHVQHADGRGRKSEERPIVVRRWERDPRRLSTADPVLIRVGVRGPSGPLLDEDRQSRHDGAFHQWPNLTTLNLHALRWYPLTSTQQD
jgi:hypothetical protein